MGCHARIESTQLASFLTTRSRNSELWFINNAALQDAILGYTAKFAERYGVKLYALAIEGNHCHADALFPEANRAHFMRDLNSAIARAVPRYTREYPGGRFWARRYSSEFLPAAEDIEEYFFYTVLQPVKDGLVEKLSDYPGYNCFHDAIWGIARKHKVIRWAEYNDAKRFKRQVAIKDYTDIVSLKYERLPGYESLSQAEYAKLMQQKLEARRAALVEKRYQKGLGFAGKTALLCMPRGQIPQHTKTSTQSSHRPRVLSICPKRRATCRAWYFRVQAAYKDASEQYRAGKLSIPFPYGTYRPYCPYQPQKE